MTRTQILSALALSLVGCVPMDGDEPTTSTESSDLTLPVDFLQFRQMSTGTSLFGNAPWDDMSYAYGQADLKTLPSTSIYDVMLRYSSPTDQTEAAIFGTDPALVHKATLSYLMVHGADSAGLSYLRGEPGQLGTEALYPYPNDDMFLGPVMLETQIPPHAAFGGAGWNNAAVRSARIYDAGMCMNEVSYWTQFDQVKTQMNNSVSQIMTNVKAQVGVLAGLIEYIATDGRVAAYIDHTDGDTKSQRGGMIAAFFVHAAIDIVADQYVNYVYDLPFFLDNGMVKIKKIRRFGSTQGPVGVSQTDINNQVEAAVQQEVDSINKQILSQQAPAITGCDPTSPNFGPAMALLDTAVQLGASKQGLSQADHTTLHSIVYDPAQWICTVDNPKDPSTGSARFLVRAARLNFYPDALGVVMFDAPDVYSNGYIGWLAIQGNPNAVQRAAQTKAMCTFTHKPGFTFANPFYTRSFAALDLF